MSRTEYKGSCLCGGVKYTLHGEPEDVVECYCSHCQLNAGGESQIVVKYSTPNVALEDPSGHAKVFLITTGTSSGKPKEKHFCGNCGCTLWTVPLVHEGRISFVRTTLIENGLKLFRPTVFLFKEEYLAKLSSE